MRNHILFKFLAVTLASLMLLAAIVSGVGILVLTEAGLENKTVEELMEEEIRNSGQNYAQQLASNYASRVLGSCPEAMVERYHPLSLFGDSFDLYGHSILDSEGNLLEGEKSYSGQDSQTYRFSPSGNYMYLLSATPVSLIPQTAGWERLVIEGVDDACDNIPDEGALVAEINISHENGSSTSFSGDGIGMIFRNSKGGVVFRAFSSDILNDLSEISALSYLSFLDKDGNLIYDASFPGDSGALSFDDDGCTVRTLSGVSEAYIVVYEAVFTAEDNSELCHLSSDAGVGVFFYDLDGYAVFRAKGAAIGEGAATGDVCGISLYDESGRPIFSSFQTEVVGTLFFDEYHRLNFYSASPVRVAAEETGKLRPALAPTGAVTPDGTEETAPPESTEVTEAATEVPAAGMTRAIPAETSTQPVLVGGKPLDAYEVQGTTYYDNDAGESIYVEFIQVPVPDYTVELYMTPKAMWSSAWSLLAFAYQNRVALTVALGVSLLVFALLAVYLCCSAGHSPGTDEIRPGGLNRLPLDLYAVCTGGGIALIAMVLYDALDHLLVRGILGFTILGYGGFACCLLLVSFAFAFAAQVKTPGCYLLKNALCGRAWHLAGRLWHFFLRLCRWIFGKLRNAAGWIGGKVARFYGLLPMTWQWLLTAFGMFLILLLTISSMESGPILVGAVICTAIVLYGIYSFGTLFQGAKRMRGGDLEAKVNSKGLIGCFREFAEELNGLSEVAVVAAREQMKSERMRSELITNVSHDIKTPLTSIINFVDLLQKPHTDEEQKSYLEVLARQSDRLKKLIDDLMEMSKASTGNLNVEITRVDAGEAVNQALGEFGDKLAAANLTPVFHQPPEPVTMLADGRLAWRAMSNLLSNAVKYALPGTRLYIDLSQVEGSVMISFKNISREMLNISADELMERFVRGDSSRNTEGSGLGLNIAKSLMELQKGRLQLLVDGDLFKATLVFPAK